MKLYLFELKPLSPFGTLPKGDTLFGSIFWQFVYAPELLKRSVAEVCSSYAMTPAMVVSTAFLMTRDGKLLLPRPALPVATRNSAKERSERIKEVRSLKLEKKKKYSFFDAAKDSYLRNLDDNGPPTSEVTLLEATESHNSISRFSGTTGENFSPFETESYLVRADFSLAVIVLLDEEQLEVDAFQTALERLGKQGFGKDASTGKGSFAVTKKQEVKFSLPDAFALMTLAPFVPDANLEAKLELSFNPFTRFGKHGGARTTPNPFKNPVLMADEGAVLQGDQETLASIFKKGFAGRAVAEVSSDLRTLHQGYSIVIPIKMRVGRS